ncbi:transcriptional regulator, TetR family [Beutenbergia cavernae DSM 12333]|uniref:Transcriptional regulator, TetR family n=1 Tax=Beutenbergia cavernae (strain ATCC BAA-8 / DSM 12333 / CCUG 43141 / JCM 11478 / NBRC 16432 / NCIMB 13614 / HKI 0122) TaxID=471853 RepID=C5C622_BEUC1|nr:TetR/AcrR family transcriptional regulator C-terminal domain-containing protein [Beutenbergia cavernae]ACQ82380.1 transcriptional regulator, TetR family [Beutenbergia cavernae DSM 12333]
MPTRRAPEDRAAASSVWLRPQRPERDDPPLTRGRIVEAAVELLDDAGLDALSMRRLAERLGVVAPSLYWHVRTKDDVLDLAVDHVFGEAGTHASSPGQPWRRCVERLAVAWRSVLVRHPWVPPVAAQRPSLGPNFLDQLEALQSTLRQAGLEGPDLSAATWTIYNQIVGSASTEATLTIGEEDRTRGQALLEDRSDRYPTLAEHRYLDNDDWSGDFMRGLGYLLTGIEAHVHASARAAET